jgi:hypothetical protein
VVDKATRFDLVAALLAADPTRVRRFLFMMLGRNQLLLLQLSQ